jgi:hypothetical protein
MFPVGVEVAFSMEENHPGLDPWCYEVSIDPADFGPRKAYITDGSRTIELLPVGADDAYKKWDDSGPTGPRWDGARDKVAADVGSILGVNVPPTLLWRSSLGCGCVQKEPPHFGQSLEMFLQGVRADPEGADEALAYLAAIYDPMNVFLDMWFGNVDRHSNLKNTLLCESSTQGLVWIIDFNCSMGHHIRPWVEPPPETSGLRDGEVPAPQIIWDHPVFRQKLTENANYYQERLSAIDDNTVRVLCHRAFGYYENCTPEVYERIGRRLIWRRERVADWVIQCLN